MIVCSLISVLLATVSASAVLGCLGSIHSRGVFLSEPGGIVEGCVYCTIGLPMASEGGSIFLYGTDPGNDAVVPVWRGVCFEMA